MDGEERPKVRSLRPAAPPDGVGPRPVPRPRRGDPPADPGAEPTTPDTAPGRRATTPRRLATGAARALHDWSRRPSGRTTLPGLFLLVLVAATATAGALLVPAAVRKPQPVAVDATATVSVTGVPEVGGSAPVFPGVTAAPGGPQSTPPVGPTPTGRPADALAGWAGQISRKTAIPVVAVEAYGYAELVLQQTRANCRLSWTTLAAIGYVESGHGSANHATLQPNGISAPEIIGLPLDGQGGRSRIPDTDQGRLDHDTVYDHALGPMQFIPSTWQEIGADADGDGVRNPHDIDDAALAAAQYLCKGDRNMTVAGDWWGAILSYNDVRRYAQDVFDKADEYGRLSRT